MPYSMIVTLRNMRPAYNIKEETFVQISHFICNFAL